MSMRYPGGLIASSPVNAAYPSGVWTQAQTQPYAAQNVWMQDQYWPNTTLLLQGNGTNGAQNNTFLDSSTNNFTITRNGNTTQGSFTPYEANGYWSNSSFSGSAYLTYNPGATAAFGTGDFTVEAWVFATDALASGDNPYICDTRGGGGAWSFSWNYNGTSNPWQLAWANSSVLQSSTSMALNTWNHCAYVRSGTTGTLYLNGVSIGTWTDSYNYSASVTSVTIGRRNSLSSGTQFLPGYLSNFRIVKGTAVYTSAFTPSAAPLTAITNTQLLTCQSNRFIDNSTNAFAITINGSPSVQAFQPFPGATTWSGSVLGGSGYFDGSGDYLTAPSDAALAVGSTFTVEFWVYRTVGSTVQWIAGNNAGSGSTSWLLEIEADNTVYGGGWTTGTQTSSTVPVAAWTHIAMVCNSGSLKIYINGVQSGTAATSIDFTTSATTYIGRYSGGTRNLTGYISNLRVLKGTALYTADFTPPTSPLTAITNTSLLLNFTNAGIFDSAMMNDLETVGNAQVSTSVVKYGTGSMAFDGSGDYLQNNNTRIITFNGSSTFTVEGWFYQTAYVSTSGYMNNVLGDLTPTAATALYWSIGMNASNQPGVRWYDGAVKTADASTVLTLNQWNHVAWVVTAGVLKIFINGVQATLTGTTTLTTPSTTVGYLIIGADRGYYMTGYIDDLRVSQGAARYIGNFTPPVARMPGQ